MVMTVPIGLTATGLGIALSGMFVGVSGAISYIAVPGLMLAGPPSPTAVAPDSRPATKPDHLARQYKKIYDIGSVAGPVTALLSVGSFLTAYCYLPTDAKVQGQLFIAAAILSVAIAPFTFTVMKRTNGELHRRAYAADERRDEKEGRKDAVSGTVESYETDDLLKWWSSLNMMRALFHVGSVACGITALVI